MRRKKILGLGLALALSVSPIVPYAANVNAEMLKTSSSAATSFKDSYIFDLIIEKLQESFGEDQVQYDYNDDTKTMHLYFEAGKDKATILAVKSEVQESWDDLLGGFEKVTEALQETVTLGLNAMSMDSDGVSCDFYVVSRFDSAHVYEERDVLAYVKNGKIQYDFMADGDLSDSSRIELDGTRDTKDTKDTKDTFSSAYSDTATMGEKNALEEAKSYLKYSEFSYKGLVEQLEYEGYSHSEAVYGVDHCGADWKEQAVKMAKSYLKYSSFSYSELVEQLEYEGFSAEDAKYGVDQNWK